jgi:predicted PurR-regulated permease PerM
VSEQRPGRTRVDGAPDPGTPQDPSTDQPAAGRDAGVARERAARARERAERARADAAEAAAAADAAETAAIAAESAESAGPAESADPARPVGIPDGDPVVDAELRAEEAGADEEFPLGRPGRPMNRRSPFRIGFAGALGAGFAYLLYQALVSARGVLVLVIVSAFLAIGLNPIVSRLERAGMRRGGAVAIVFLGLLGFFALFGYAVLPLVINQVTNFVDAVPNYVKDLQGNGTIRDLDHRFGLIDKLNQYVTTGEFGTRIAGNVVTVTQQVAGFVLKALTILILTLYFLSSFNSIKRTAYRLVPRSRRARVSLIGDEVLNRVGGYVAGAVVVALIAGVASLVWVSSLGIPYPLALALIVTLTDVIPLIGATIGAVIVTAVAFFVSLPVGIATGIFFLVYQQMENYLIYPRVMSRSVDVNPAAAIVGALIGGTLLGFVGALLAVPATAAIQLILREVLVPRQDAQ